MYRSRSRHYQFRRDVFVGIALLMLLGILLQVFATPVLADDRYRPESHHRGAPDEHVDGWRLGGRLGSGGYEVFRRDRHGWERVPGSGVQLAGPSHSPWLLNSRYEIYRWTDYGFRRVSGSALDITDGWVIGTDRRHGGYGVYRWNGHRFERTPGAGVEIGGGYQHPWLVNDRGERFEWDGHHWLATGGRRPGRYEIPRYGDDLPDGRWRD